MRSFSQLTDDFIYKVTNIFTTDIECKSVARFFSIGKIISILIAIGAIIFIMIATFSSGVEFKEYLGQNPVYIVFFMLAGMSFFVAYNLKTIELYFCDKNYEAAITDLIVLLISQLVLISMLNIFIIVMILYKSKKAYGLSLLETLKIRAILPYCKLSIFIIITNIFIMYEACLINQII